MIAESVSTALARRIKNSALDHGDIAAWAGMTPHMLTKIIRGTHVPSLPVFVTLCHALGLEASVVLAEAVALSGERPGDPYDGRTLVPLLPKRAKPDARRVGLTLDPGVSAYLPQAIIDDLKAGLDARNDDLIDQTMALAWSYGWPYRKLADAVGLSTGRAYQRVADYYASGRPLSGAVYPFEPGFALRIDKRGQKLRTRER